MNSHEPPVQTVSSSPENKLYLCKVGYNFASSRKDMPAGIRGSVEDESHE